MGKKGFLKFFLALTLFYIGYGSTIAADDDIKISALAIRPGDFIKIIVNEPVDAQVEVEFVDGVKRLQSYNNRFIGLIPASYFTKPGEYGLSVRIIRGNQTFTKEYPIEVVKRDFPEDRVIIAEKTRKEILTTDNVNSDANKTSDVRQKAQVEIFPPLWEGRFIWPVRGKVTTQYGLIRYMNNIIEGRHSGLDISAPTGTPVLACNKGKVIFAGTLYVTGLTVIVQHGLDLYTSYCHLSKITAHEGDLVNEGETIGQVGMSGLATGPHLHLTVRIGDTCIDPYLLLDREICWEF